MSHWLNVFFSLKKSKKHKVFSLVLFHMLLKGAAQSL